jgi:hypothetical protein
VHKQNKHTILNGISALNSFLSGVGVLILHKHNIHDENGRDTRWRSWLRHCVKSGMSQVRFRWSHFSLTVAVGSTQPLTEMGTRII